MDRTKIKGVIFDVDGVLLDSMAIWTDLGARYLMSLGRTPEEGLAEILFSMSMEQGAAYLNERYGLGREQSEIMDGLGDLLRDFYFYEVAAKPDALELLQCLSAAGVKMTAATSSPREHIERALSRNGLLGFIDRLFTVAEVGVSKHDPEIYHLASKSMGTAPRETYVFEDSLYALETAAAAGYHTVGVFDAAGEADQEGLREKSEIYITNLGEFIDRADF